MAGMEQLEIHSKSYLVRWVNVKAEHTISWSIRPDKKSINFGIFKHPGPGAAPTPRLPSSTFEPPPTPALRPEDASSHGSLSSRSASSTATEKLKSIGLKPIWWYGACDANRVSTGTYDVPPNEGGMYALVFDNTFAKSFAKSATFVLLTYPTKSPPQANHHMHHIQGSSNESSTSLKESLNTRKAPLKRGSSESFSQLATSTSKRSDDARNANSTGSVSPNGANFFTGVLQKRRRKRHQGWARRFFSLDFTSSTLSYYQNKNTQAVRGAVPVSLAVVSANPTTRQISIDSGAELWHLKAVCQKDFEDWTRALESARMSIAPNTSSPVNRVDSLSRRTSNVLPSPEEEEQWSKAGEILKRVRRSRDTAKSLAVDTDPKYLPLSTPQPSFARQDSNPMSGASSGSGSPTEKNLPNGYFGDGERRAFWKRKQSSDRPMPGTYRSVSATPSMRSAKTGPPTPRTASVAQDNKPLESHPEEEGLHDRCVSLLRDLDSIVADFALLLAEGKQRRSTPMPSTVSRYSIETQGDEEFFDAEGINDSQLLSIHHESGDEADEAEHGFGSDEEFSTASEDEEGGAAGTRKVDTGTSTPTFPPKSKSLAPLPAAKVKRRNTVPPPTVTPPSLVGFLRKNVGKDLSTISMPVSANEPISLLQRVSEILEYSTLLDEAASKPGSSNEALLYVAAFAIANFSSARVKERSIRKPFNPLLGETFELVREDRGFRFISEKVSHRPFRMACQAESENWTLTHSPMPTQKFWGKSAELITDGKFRVTLHSLGQRFSWTPATSFLRNIIAGEKYVEPVGTMFVANESTGEKAIVTFKSKGMFSGRSEEVGVQVLDSYGDELPLGLTGKWTSSLQVTSHGNIKSNEPPIWSVAELPPEASKRYGFTSFAASLNEITALEKDKLPPTDSRLRPDQRAAEAGDFETAESFKAKLEEEQRKRRKVMEEQGVEWQPKWFERIEGADIGEEVWIAKGGKESYWEERTRSQWEGVEKIFDID